MVVWIPDNDPAGIQCSQKIKASLGSHCKLFISIPDPGKDARDLLAKVGESNYSYLDKNKVALLGRSMGGGVAFQALVIQPGVFDAAIVYAATSTLAADNFNKWQRNDYPIGKQILKKYGTPKENPEVWRDMSSRYFFSQITEPVLMIHGTKDESCDISWARATHRALQRSGVDVTYVEYPGAPHYMYGEWNDSIKRVGTFLQKNLA